MLLSLIPEEEHQDLVKQSLSLPANDFKHHGSVLHIDPKDSTYALVYKQYACLAKSMLGNPIIGYNTDGTSVVAMFVRLVKRATDPLTEITDRQNPVIFNKKDVACQAFNAVFADDLKDKQEFFEIVVYNLQTDYGLRVDFLDKQNKELNAVNYIKAHERLVFAADKSRDNVQLGITLKTSVTMEHDAAKPSEEQAALFYKINIRTEKKSSIEALPLVCCDSKRVITVQRVKRLVTMRHLEEHFEDMPVFRGVVLPRQTTRGLGRLSQLSKDSLVSQSYVVQMVSDNVEKLLIKTDTVMIDLKPQPCASFRLYLSCSSSLKVYASFIEAETLQSFQGKSIEELQTVLETFVKDKLKTMLIHQSLSDTSCCIHSEACVFDKLITLGDCGHKSVCQPCLEQYQSYCLSQHNKDFVCPLCKRKIVFAAFF